MEVAPPNGEAGEDSGAEGVAGASARLTTVGAPRTAAAMVVKKATVENFIFDKRFELKESGVL
jgi:hypothetical protein